MIEIIILELDVINSYHSNLQGYVSLSFHFALSTFHLYFVPQKKKKMKIKSKKILLFIINLCSIK